MARRARINFRVKNNLSTGAKRYIKGAEEIKKSVPEAVRESLIFIRATQRALAPIDRQNRIPRSLNMRWSGSEGAVFTVYPVAFFTAEGTGIAGGWATKPYFIPRDSKRYPKSRAHYNPQPPGTYQPPGTSMVFERAGGAAIGFMHGGIDAQNWFRKGVEAADPKIMREWDKVIKRALGRGL